MPSSSDIDFLIAVADLQVKGFAGMFTNRMYTKAQAKRLEREGLLESSYMDVADGDGFTRDGHKPRLGYALTQEGLDAIPESERWWNSGALADLIDRRTEEDAG